MTREELARYDGRDGRPVYVAVQGTIYDLTGSPLWRNGNHEGAHQAGQELGEELKSAPHVRALIERFPVVGRIEVRQKKEKKDHSIAGIPLVSVIIMLFVLILLIVTFTL